MKTARLELRQQIADRLDGIDAKRDKNYLDAIIFSLSSGDPEPLKSLGKSAIRGAARVYSSNEEDEDAARAQRAQKLNAR